MTQCSNCKQEIPNFGPFFQPKLCEKCADAAWAEVSAWAEEGSVQKANAWAEEGIRKYGNEAVAWLRRWKVNLANYPNDLKELDMAIEIVKGTQNVNNS